MHDSNHFVDMLEERGIRREWIDRVIQEPEKVEKHEDGTTHFIKRISEFDNRWLRVIVNTRGKSELRVTAFFDRRLRRQYENQGG